MASKFLCLLLPDVNQNPTDTHRVLLYHSGEHGKCVFKGLIVSKPRFCCLNVPMAHGVSLQLFEQRAHKKIVRMGKCVNGGTVTLLVLRERLKEFKKGRKAGSGYCL